MHNETFEKSSEEVRSVAVGKSDQTQYAHSNRVSRWPLVLRTHLLCTYVNTAVYMVMCSHLRAIDYWAEALENSHCTMWGIETQ